MQKELRHNLGLIRTKSTNIKPSTCANAKRVHTPGMNYKFVYFCIRMFTCVYVFVRMCKYA